MFLYFWQKNLNFSLSSLLRLYLQGFADNIYAELLLEADSSIFAHIYLNCVMFLGENLKNMLKMSKMFDHIGGKNADF